MTRDDDDAANRDPSGLTTEQLHREVGLLEEQVTRRLQAQNDILREHTDGEVAVLAERLDGIDKATVVLNEIVTRVPTDVQKEVGHLRELSEEKFRSVATQFHERDTRSERESKDNKVAVDAAFAAQKEAASEQNKSNTLAISKSESATAETINKLNQLFQTTITGQSDKIDDLRQRVAAVEQRKLGSDERRDQGQWTVGTIIAVASLIFFAMSAMAGVAVLMFTRKP